MKAFRKLPLLAVAVVVASSCVGQIDQGQPEDRAVVEDRGIVALANIQQFPDRAVCADPGPGLMRCFARVRVKDDGITPYAATGPQGFGPADLQSAYNIPTTGGAGMTIAIVDAQDNPNAESDLAVYRQYYGLPPCTTANGCFKKVNQNGVQGSYPAADSGWAGEIALDLDMASAACPKCKILLVEANSASMANLGAAVNTAVALGATVVSNSWGGSEDSSVTASDTAYFKHPGVAIFVSAGDNGYGAEYPASSAYVTAVGGTSLVKSSTPRGWTEGVWGSSTNKNGGTGSGCSKYIAKPSWQTDTKCTKRTVADVAAVADPNTGVAVYDTYGGNGWNVYGGTSAASPIVAAIYAATGRGAATGQLSYQYPGDFYDVTTGTNGSCSGTYLCTAVAGYDGPTGNGTPNGGALTGGTTCTPSCSGMQCGSDGCGGTCGTCASGTTCNSSGQCVSSCTPSCSGKVCGSDGCGGTCGTCASGSTCSSAGQCVAACTPNCSGKVCGSDGCGGSCGTCGSGSSCSTSGQCVASSCAHPICSTGTKLTTTCDTCVAKICASDSYCCNSSWDSTCVGEVTSICGQSCGGSGSGTCAHSECSTGTKLSKTCDACVSKVCAADSYCCNHAWDSQCVSEVATYCGQSC